MFRKIPRSPAFPSIYAALRAFLVPQCPRNAWLNLVYSWRNIGGNSKPAPAMALSDMAIRKAKPADSPVSLFDGGGLYLEIVPSGGKWWRLKYRHGGKEKRLSLGTSPGTSLKAAREARDSARKQLAAGIDPSTERKTAKEANRLATLSTLERVGRAWLEHRSRAWTTGTRAKVAWPFVQISQWWRGCESAVVASARSHDSVRFETSGMPRS
jgi:hypothetical protein